MCPVLAKRSGADTVTPQSPFDYLVRHLFTQSTSKVVHQDEELSSAAHVSRIDRNAKFTIPVR